MELVIVAIGLITFIIVLNVIGGKQKSRTNNARGGGRLSPSWPSKQPPAALGVAAGHPARSAAERLEAALSPDFESRVQYRVQSVQPGMTSSEWAWKWFELKRYFLMCALLRNVPMYSTKADDVWHEMLMFTREYESFCQQFCGAYIHHAPHGKDDNKPEAGNRAWFDWLYAELFEMSPASGKVWGSFFREPLSRSMLSELEAMSEADIRSKWFRSDTVSRFNDLDRTAAYLVSAAKRQVNATRKRSKSAYKSDSFDDGTAMMSSGWLLLYFSAVEPNNLQQRMDEQDNRLGGSSGYSGDDSSRHGGSSHHGHSHNGHDHHDGGSSSCGGGGGD